ncbi:MAG TPA: hypothetical protein PLO52_00455 [Flavobacterium alvei]|nr:hypothetical protein [Flavobacterium alvei]
MNKNVNLHYYVNTDKIKYLNDLNDETTIFFDLNDPDGFDGNTIQVDETCEEIFKIINKGK